ncbi:PfkB family carbohydrate kinase [Salinarimonas chemoclinalis]|uniref:PfkB family carbohydrate kinase n=1 Tax=Salinarimonas chemoclinalis TaxID=3241599 RepID=UPI003557DAA1
MRILVVANVNCDRVRLLDEPLHAGGRLAVRETRERTGGAGYHAAAAIARLGGRAWLSTSIAADERGTRLVADVAARGIETTAVVRAHPATTPLEILVEPDGQRTILYQPAAAPPAIWPEPGRQAPFDAIYVNTAAAMPGGATALVGEGAPVLAQVPVVVGEGTHPAPLLVCSADERPDLGLAEVWARAVRVSAGRAQRLVLTDGPRPIRIVGDGRVRETIAVAPIDGLDTTGAGDFFAGALALRLASGLALPDACAAAARDAASLLRARETW